jgi:hypothetical protein
VARGANSKYSLWSDAVLGVAGAVRTEFAERTDSATLALYGRGAWVISPLMLGWSIKKFLLNSFIRLSYVNSSWEFGEGKLLRRLTEVGFDSTVEASVKIVCDVSGFLMLEAYKLLDR